MLLFAVSRIIQSVPLAFGASLVVFLVMRFIPGDPAIIYAGPDAPQESIDLLRKQFGLEEPLPVQYVIWLKNLLQGDMGTSYLSRVPVTELLSQRIPATLELTVTAMVITIVSGVLSGVLAAIKTGTAIDAVITSLAGISIAMPHFWLGILTIYVFAQVLGWLPAGGRVSITEDFGEGLRHLLLPALILSTTTAATLSRLVKSSMLEVLYEDYVRTARSKGLSSQQVILGHVLRNALVPVITVIALQFGGLLGGAVVIESVFAWPGLGRLMLDSLGNRDYAVVQGGLLCLVFVFILVNLMTDVIYGMLDPRIRVGGSASV